MDGPRRVQPEDPSRNVIDGGWGMLYWVARDVVAATMNYYFKCPNCGSDERFVRPSEQSSSSGGASSFFLRFNRRDCLRIIRWRRIQCLKCTHIFRQPPLPGTPLSHFAAWIACLTVIAMVVGVAGFAAPELAPALPSVAVISAIEHAIACAAVGDGLHYRKPGVPDRRYAWWPPPGAKPSSGRELSTKYRLKPLSSEDVARQSHPEPNAAGATAVIDASKPQ